MVASQLAVAAGGLDLEQHSTTNKSTGCFHKVFFLISGADGIIIGEECWLSTEGILVESSFGKTESRHRRIEKTCFILFHD